MPSCPAYLSRNRVQRKRPSTAHAVSIKAAPASPRVSQFPHEGYAGSPLLLSSVVHVSVWIPHIRTNACFLYTNLVETATCASFTTRNIPPSQCDNLNNRQRGHGRPLKPQVLQPPLESTDITSHGIYSNVPRYPKMPGHMRIRVQLLEPNRRIRTRAMDGRQTDHQTTQRGAPTASSD